MQLHCGRRDGCPRESGCHFKGKEVGCLKPAQPDSCPAVCRVLRGASLSPLSLHCRLTAIPQAVQGTDGQWWPLQGGGEHLRPTTALTAGVLRAGC